MGMIGSPLDRETAAALAKVLEAAGWTVWWERNIPAGRTWRSVFVNAINEARRVFKTSICAIVL
jgi:hypothetical protein